MSVVGWIWIAVYLLVFLVVAVCAIKALNQRDRLDAELDELKEEYDILAYDYVEAAKKAVNAEAAAKKDREEVAELKQAIGLWEEHAKELRRGHNIYREQNEALKAAIRNFEKMPRVSGSGLLKHIGNAGNQLDQAASLIEKATLKAQAKS